MNKADKKYIAQKLIDGLNLLTIRFAPEGIQDINGQKRYNKNVGNYFTKAELKYMLKILKEINAGLKIKLDEESNEITDFDDQVQGKPDKDIAKAKMKEKYPNDSDIADIIDVYFLVKNKDKVGDKAKKVD